MKTTPEQVARVFAAKLLEEIGAANLAEVNRLNTPEDRAAGICHSHDFCDANMVMLAAFAQCEGISEDDACDTATQTDEGTAHWNKAWDIAADNRFFAED